MAQKSTDGFARDLGYLDAFFDKLEAHGASMGGAGGDRLRTLVGEERRRWAEIKSLLAGGAPQAAGPTPAARTNSDLASARGGAPAAPAGRGSPSNLTVGSLRGARAKGGT